MCTLILLYKVIRDYPIIALHNRYALRGSIEYPVQELKMKFRVFCPLALPINGTWIGFNERGILCAVTDQHTGEEIEPRRSRGLLLDILGNFDDVEEAKDYLIRELKRGLYKRGNFVIADREDAYHVIFDNEVFVREVRPGAYVVTNITPLPMIKVGGEVKERLESGEKEEESGTSG